MCTLLLKQKALRLWLAALSCFLFGEVYPRKRFVFQTHLKTFSFKVKSEIIWFKIWLKVCKLNIPNISFLAFLSTLHYNNVDHQLLRTWCFVWGTSFSVLTLCHVCSHQVHIWSWTRRRRFQLTRELIRSGSNGGHFSRRNRRSPARIAFVYLCLTVMHTDKRHLVCV